jgi:hypothetical protein
MLCCPSGRQEQHSSFQSTAGKLTAYFQWRESTARLGMADERQSVRSAVDTASVFRQASLSNGRHSLAACQGGCSKEIEECRSYLWSHAHRLGFRERFWAAAHCLHATDQRHLSWCAPCDRGSDGSVDDPPCHRFSTPAGGGQSSRSSPTTQSTSSGVVADNRGQRRSAMWLRRKNQ